MNFTLKQLRYFDAALRSGSIARAATEMNISQSSITAAIDQIEQTIGAELFRRIPAKGLIATELGRAAGKHIAAFLDQSRVFESDLLSLVGDPTGTLRLACYEPTAPYVLPPLLRKIADSYPEVRIDVMEGDMLVVNDLLRSGSVDAVLTYRRYTHPDNRFVPLFRARPWALIPEHSPLSGQASVTLGDLAAQPLIMLDVHGTRDYFLTMFQNQGLTPDIVHSTKSGAVLRGLVGAQFGHAILNICGPNDRDRQGGYIATPIAGEVDVPLYGIAYAPQLENSAVVRAIIDTGTALARQGTFEHLLMEP
ncbi:LysR substrate-binding domain-containing protein [Ruegeria sp. HKCCD8929]|uniref:LysR substrate-binding domain-containing protein n=1 Tax=Ruegeria sp. HKCCD8929 TaxID=2683006 RepID=UPI001488DE71|nr:LysR substrate-binding domain-containing protein [Ruegeria sp. HKCCD8929]